MEFLAPLYLWFKALHIMSVISWMAGLFYLPRLFVHHAEKAADNHELSNVFNIMQEKLFNVIMRPAMMATWGFSLLMLATGLVDAASGWFVMKLITVTLMTAYHFWCGARVREFAEGKNTRDGKYYRFANEVPTILMIIIVIMAVVKPF